MHFPLFATKPFEEQVERVIRALQENGGLEPPGVEAASQHHFVNTKVLRGRA
jgi:hypothetical protein